MKRRRMSPVSLAGALALLSGLGLIAVVSVSGGALTQISPTEQQQTVNAVVQTRLAETAASKATQSAQGTAFAQAALDAQATANFEATIQGEINRIATATAQAQASAVPKPVQHNADWTPVIQTFDGIDMVLVPASCFNFGITLQQLDTLSQQYFNFFSMEVPPQQLCFDAPFWISRTEVTNAQFARLSGQAAQASAGGDDQPRVNLSWAEAYHFAARVGMRLPTEAQWEYAARGPDDLLFPWGNDFVEANAEFGGDQVENVGSRPGGASWVGALDMSGSVWEWTNSLANYYPYATDDGREDPSLQLGNRIMRGGSYFISQCHLLTLCSDNHPPDYTSVDLGFRLALAHQP